MPSAKLALAVTSCLASATAAAQPAPPAPPTPAPPTAQPAPQPPDPQPGSPPAQPADAPPPAVQPAPPAAQPPPTAAQSAPPAVQPAPPAVQPAPPAVQPAPPAPPPTARSVLPAILPTAVGSTFDGRVDFTDFGDSGPDVRLLALTLHGQYIAPLGLGGYFSLPLAFLLDSDNGEVYAGNVELGGIYVLRRADADIYLRAGFALDPQSGTATLDQGLSVVFAHLVPRPADALATGLNTSWLRGGVGLRLTSGALALGAAAGVDYALASDGEADTDAVVHLSGAIGTAHPGFGLSAGVTILSIQNGAEGGDDTSASLQVIGDVPVRGGARIYGVLGANLEEGTAAFSLGLGLRVTL